MVSVRFSSISLRILVRRSRPQSVSITSMADQEIVWEFFGVKVPANESVSLEGGLIGGHVETPHITQVALGANPKPGRHTVFIEANDSKVAIGTLEKDRCEQFQVDFVANDMVFSHTGKSEVYMSGYNTMSAFEVESSEEESDEEDDDEDVPAAVPLKQNNLMSTKAAKAKQQAMINQEAAMASIKNTLSGAPLNGKDFSDMDDDEDDEEQSELGSDEDDEEDDEEMDEEEEGNALLQALAGEDDSDDDDDDDDDEDEEPAVQVPAVGRGKRAGALAMTPQVLKKARLAEGKAPASAPAKASSQPAAGTAEAQYEKDLKAFLKQSGGEVNLSILGSVKKPDLFPKSTKLKAFLQAHSSSFTVQGDKVLLK